ncbi:hypothetical protein E1B28_009759 [Marasmius oreades]|uniref:DUF6533 domain-containing protein n=1 Tax=Marasmius oreades TaxID=181124 RepID=A0A9P7RVY1_9AGAR|nr:uncharacterized protein E1B28_009759 [Marasmius oreades]KAG7090660.1 hypothetical protein E1B28_009759 [Marasmius oreades]
MEVVESLAEPVSSVRVENYFFLLAITILYYDHFLTLDQEICAIWKRQTKFNWGCYLFLINRYVSFFGDIVAAVSLFYPSFSISRSAFLVKIIIQAVIGVTISLRVYALYGCNRRLLVIFMTVIVIAFITYMVLFAAADPDPSSSPVYGCHSICDAASASKLVAGWGAILFFDAVLFGMTLFKAHQFKKDFDKVKVEMFSSTGSPSIRSIITRDGSIYFAGMALANLVNIVDFY